MQLSPKRKALMIFAVFVLLVLVIVNCANWYLFGSFHTLLQTELDQYLSGVATLIGRQIPWQTVSRFVPGDESSREYRELAAPLEEIRRAFELSDLTVLDPSNKTLFSLSTIKPIGSENPTLGLEELGLAAAWSGRPATGDVAQVGEGYLMTAFAPVRAPDGTVGAVIAVEADVNFFKVLDILQKLTYAVTLLSLLAIGVVALLCRRIIKYFLDVDEVLQRTDKLATVGKLAASVTHEIRNPLGIISTTAELIQKRLSRQPTDPKLPGLFEHILGEIDRLNGIITRFLELSKSPPIQYERVALVDLFSPTVTLLKRDLERDGIQFSWDLPVPGHVVEVDTSKLRQVLLNCLLNAREALRDRPRRELALSTRVDHRHGSDRLVVQVHDTGPGIPKQVLDRIFEPFVTTKDTGSGLGLAVVKNVVDEHGGEVDVDTVPDRGTRITLTIPAARRA
ncbi:MAG: hypothetical protein HY815_20745 [Candidatus Riflebacteria bacterium]|nr:hypothetical protein [Candidatus Riflebacteria bacterium]